MGTAILDLDAVKRVLGITDAKSDVWLDTAIAAVGDAIESLTGRWFASRGSATYYFDAPGDEDELPLPMGVASVTYLGVAYSDQPDDGTGTYTQIPAASFYLDPPAHQRRTGEPATCISLAAGATPFPTDGQKRAVKVTATWGGHSVPRITQIAFAAVTRAFRAKESGGADYAVVGPDGGMKILRDFAPAEMAELWAMGEVIVDPADD